MGLKKISLLHIGDVHYPELKNAGVLGDLKGGLPSQISLDKLIPPRIVEISKVVTRLLESEDSVLGAIQTGDITTRGNLEGYEDGISFLARMLQMDTGLWSSKCLVVVPGNHDIDRAGVEKGGDPIRKFESLHEAWSRLEHASTSFYSGSPSAIDRTVLTESGISSQVRIIPLNTCLLCGDYFSLPDALKKDLGVALEKLKSGIGEDAYADILIEQVDCPAVSREDVDQLVSLIKNGSPGAVTIVAGHHPLMPQPTPRISGYVELINAGYIRESILSTERNTIYLHGHIHQDPLLIVSKSVGGNRIIHVSAPALQDGFNLVSLHFSEETGQAVGMTIVPYRFGDQLALAPRPPLRLRLVDDGALWSEIDQDWMAFTLEKLASPSTVLRYNDLFRAVPADLKDSVLDQAKIHSKLKEALETLELLEIIQITNQTRAPQLWQLRRRSV